MCAARTCETDRLRNEDGSCLLRERLEMHAFSVSYKFFHLAKNVLFSLGDQPMFRCFALRCENPFAAGLFVVLLSFTAVGASAQGRLEMVGQAGIPEGSARRIAASGNVAGVITLGPNSLYFFDVSDPTAPILASVFDLTGDSSDIRISGGIAYVCYIQDSRESQPRFHGVRAIDVTSPDQPSLLGEYSIAPISVNSAGSNTLDVIGTVVYVHVPISRIFAIDFGDPTNPVVLGSSARGAGDLIKLIGGNRIAAIFTNETVKVLDRTAIDSLRLIGLYRPEVLPPRQGATVNTTSFVTDIASNGNGQRVYIGLASLTDDDRFEGNGIQRVAFEPEGVFPSVRFLNAVYTTNSVYSLEVSNADGAVIAANGHAGVVAFNKFLTQEIGKVDTPGFAQDIAIQGNIIFAADGTNGMVVMRYRPNLAEGFSTN